MNEDIAKHLGKTSDGKISAPYITPDKYDPSLLVRVLRSENRTQYGIEENNLPFKGYDSWNCYETSFLTHNGFPVTIVTNISYPADSKYIVESKSLKLFLNSFNMCRLGNNISEARSVFEGLLILYLEKLLECPIIVDTFDEKEFKYNTLFNYTQGQVDISNQIPVEKINFDSYNESPQLLTQNLYDNELIFLSSALRSNCKITNQPDWGDIYIEMKGNVVTKESLLQYIVSLRQENHFHEEICEMVYNRLWSMFYPSSLLVVCHYTRRGGIDINPVRCNKNYLLQGYTLFKKTMRQ